MRLGRWLGAHPLLVDGLLAAVVLLLGLGEVWAGLVGPETFPGPRAAHTVFVVVVALPLLVRRRWPLAALVAVAVLSEVWTLSLFSVRQQPPFEPFVAQLLVAYAAGAYTRGRSARAAIVIVAVATVSDALDLALGGPAGAIVPADVMLLAAFALGFGVAAQRRRADAQQALAAQLERDQDEAARQAVADERARMARELHDVISHDVSLMVLQAGVERRLSGADGSPAGQALASIESAGRDALGELRRMLGVLRKPDDAAPLQPQPGLADLPVLLTQVREAGLAAEIAVQGVPAPLPAGLDLAAYRIVQESLTNVAKHAGSTASIVVRYLDDGLELEVVDTGAPVPAGAPIPSAGHGLLGMRERVRLYGGTLDASPQPGGGFRVIARIPIPSAP